MSQPDINLLDEAGIRVQAHGPVLYIDINSPANRNAVDTALSQNLAYIFGRTNESPAQVEVWAKENTCGVIVLRSALPGIFVAGGDLKELAVIDKDAADVFTERMQAVCHTLSTCMLPTVTLMAAPAFGGGVELALATDFRWSLAQDTAFHFWQAKWAVPAGWHGATRLQEITGWPARRVALTFLLQDSLTEDQAAKFGIVDRIFRAPDEAHQALVDLALHYLACPEKLRESLLERGTITKHIEQAREFDKTIFSQHWLNEELRLRLQKFVSRKNIKR